MEKTDIKISFTILTHNETDELRKVLEQIKSIKTLWDEVVIVDDFSNNTGTISILEWAKNDEQLQAKILQRALAGDFAAQKNYAASQCKNDYIFNIDADETLDESLAKSFREIIAINPDVEYFRLPRINKVEGITLAHVNAWHWQVSQQRTEIEDAPLTPDSELFKLLKVYNLVISENNGLVKFYTPIVNWPDLQGRIYKRVPSIQWQNKVHEVVVGYKRFANFPLDKKFSILHYKTLAKQEQQNNFYSTIR
jgi:glycosyltransferase involved in cell wall biosynthesis